MEPSCRARSSGVSACTRRRVENLLRLAVPGCSSVVTAPRLQIPNHTVPGGLAVLLLRTPDARHGHRDVGTEQVRHSFAFAAADFWLTRPSGTPRTRRFTSLVWAGRSPRTSRWIWRRAEVGEIFPGQRLGERHGTAFPGGGAGDGLRDLLGALRSSGGSCPPLPLVTVRWRPGDGAAPIGHQQEHRHGDERAEHHLEQPVAEQRPGRRGRDECPIIRPVV